MTYTLKKVTTEARPLDPAQYEFTTLEDREKADGTPVEVKGRIQRYTLESLEAERDSYQALVDERQEKINSIEALTK